MSPNEILECLTEQCKRVGMDHYNLEFFINDIGLLSVSDGGVIYDVYLHSRLFGKTKNQLSWGNILSVKLDKYIANSIEKAPPTDKQFELFFDYIFDNLSEPFKECFWKAAKDVIDTKLAVEGKQWPSKTE